MQLAVLKNYKNVGKLHGNGDSFESGHVKHFEFEDIKKLGSLIKTVSSNPKYSVCIGTFPRNGEVLPKNKADIGDMTRTKDVVNKGHILVVDNDYGGKLDVDVFGKYWDTFKDAGYVHSKSGSTLAGKKKHGSHTYYIVQDGNRTLTTAMEILEAICIVEGLCKIEFHKTGKAVVKTPVDLALSQNSRVVYEDDKDLKIVDGSTIDLTAYPKNHKKIMKDAAKIVKKMLGKVEKKSLKLHATYVKDFTGKKIKGKKKIRTSLITYEEHEVDEKFKLYLDNKCVGTVGDLVLGKMEGMVYFSDLYEPDYGGGSQKAIYYPDTKTFFSQAHGGVTYHVVLSDKFNDELIAEFLKEVPYLEDAHTISDEYLEILAVRDIVNKKRIIREYAKENGVTALDVENEIKRLSVLRETFDKFYDLWLRGEYDKTVNPESRLEPLIKYRETAHMVNIGGKIAIVSTYEDDSKNVMTNINPLDVENRLWSDRKTTILNVNTTNGETTFTKVDTPTLFVEGHDGDDCGVINPCKRWIGMDFAPNKDLNVAYNLFNGFPTTPVKGDISRWESHMTKCFGKKHYNFIMDWFADMYQNPDRKCTFAVVVKGSKGTGKNTFEDTLGRLLLSKENYFRTATQVQLFGKFNSHLMSNLLTVGQEIVWGGRHDNDSILKDMITESTRVVERKGIDSFSVNNFSRLYMTSNADWVVPASKDERRFYVAGTKDGMHTKKDWQSFHKWLKEDGVLEALMYEMVNRDVSKFNNVFCPVTTELSEQKHETLYGIDRFVVDAVENGYFGQYNANSFDNVIDLEDGVKIPIADLHSKYAETNNVKKMSVNKFSRELSKIGISKRGVFNNKKCIVIPNVSKLRKILEKELGVLVSDNL